MRNAFKQGDHVCVLYDSEEEQLTIAARYVAEGLRSLERCFYVADTRAALDRFRTALIAEGIDAVAMVQRGALVEATKSEAHLVDGRFDCERMLRLLNEAVESALNDGFLGLRTCGDMTWLLDDAPGSNEVVEYEALLNQFFQNVRAVGMCQYNRRRLPAGLIDHALTTHPTTMIDREQKRNPLYRPAPVERSAPSRDSRAAR